MIKRLISFILTLVLLVAIPLEARYRYNPYTRKLDYYEAAGDIALGDIGDITLTGLATGNILYYNGTAWVNLATGANTNVLTLAGGIPSWAAPGAPAAHAASHMVAGADLVDHDQLTNYLAAQHLTLPNTLVAVLTDHNAAAHVALGFLALPSTIAAVLTDHNQAAHNALLIDADTVDGEHAAAIVTNARVKAHFPDTIANILSDHNLAAHTALGLYDAPGDVDHNLTTNYAANQHVVLPATIAAVLTDHDLAAHTALGLFDASADVDHDATTNWVANKHINWTAAASNFSTSEDFTLAWTEAADHATITQTAVAGIENVPLIYIADDRTGVTVDEAIEATLRINADGPVYAFYIQDGAALFEDIAYFSADTYQYEDVFMDWDDAADHAVIAQSAVAGTEGQPLIYIDDDRVGATVSDYTEATIYIDTAAVRAIYISGGYGIELAGNAGIKVGGEINADSFINWSSRWITILDANNAGDSIFAWRYSNYGADDTSAIFMGKLDPFDMTDHDDYESPTFVLTNSEGADANDYSGVVIGERAQANVKVAHYFDFYAMTGAADGTPDPSNAELAAIFRFGALGTTVPDYATAPGDVLIEGKLEVVDTLGYDHTTDHNLFLGWQAGLDIAAGGQYNTLVGEQAGTDVTTGDNTTLVGYQAGFKLTTSGNNTAVGYKALTGGAPTPDADTKENTAVGMEALYSLGYAGQRNTAVGHQSSYTIIDEAVDNTTVGWRAGYLMGGNSSNNTYIGSGTGSGDGTGNTNNVGVGSGAMTVVTSGVNNVIIGFQAAEDITAGASNVIIGYMAAEGWLTTDSNKLIIANTDTATPLLYGDFTTGDMIAASLTHNSDHKVTGYNRYDTIYWIESFDHGIAANRYSQMWDITSLNTQGNGTNTIDTTPSHITLTTDNNAIGDNEGTITYKQIIERSRLNRSEFSVDLGQTANTQFYMGWNTSQTNAMVAAADEYVIIFFDVSDNANWQIKVGDGATEDVFTSAVAADTNDIRHEIWVEADGTVHWRVNGTELDITGSVDNLMTANGHYLIVCQAQSVTGAAAIVAEMCYVENEKTKSN